MRVIAILLPLLMLGAAEPINSPQPVPPPSAYPIAPSLPDCRTLHIANTGDRAIFQRLGDLPSADAYQAVLRSGTDGCPDPLLVSERVGWARQEPAN